VTNLLERIKKGLSPARRKKIDARARELIAEFPDREPVVLSSLATLEPKAPIRRRRQVVHA
jgi:hypothetical protein